MVAETNLTPGPQKSNSMASLLEAEEERKLSLKVIGQIKNTYLLIENEEGFDQYVVVIDDVLEFLEQGKNLFSRHVKEVGDGVKPGQETIILDTDGKVAAVGKAILTKDEMSKFKTGVAVKTRRGRKRHR